MTAIDDSSMTPEVRAEFHRALSAVILRHGALVREDPSIYGWYDGEYPHARRHIEACGVARHGKPEASRWYEFDGTFSPSLHCQGHDLTFTCACGKYTDRVVRYEGEPGRLIALVFAEAFTNVKRA